MKIFRTDISLNNTVVTVISKSVILLVNFFIVIVTTQLWGSTGRGEIALIIANVSIITILCNITCGSTIAFYSSKEDRDSLFFIALAGALILSLFGALISSLSIGLRYFIVLFIISFLSSLACSISMYWLGKNKIKLFNILSLSSPVSILIFLPVFYFIFKITSINAYFYAYFAGLGTVLIAGTMSLLRLESFKIPHLHIHDIRKIVTYGIKNESNNFIQFLNYRLSYFFIAKWLGLASLGIFSVAVACAEAIWIISRSMSALHFSNVINTKNQNTSITATKVLARQSFWISLIFMGILTLIPGSFFEYIFGNGFGSIKIYLIYLIPGIIAIAVSNLYDHYFSGTGKLNILIYKSIFGLIATLILLLLLTEKFHLTGVCISLNVSYLLSSFYLFYRFRRETEKKR
jgi:O-antigen/teichoic acid export membrane protein